MAFKKRSNRGYTLIELMMIISIISIVSSIVFPRFDALVTRASQAKARANLGVIRSALQAYYSATDGHWPLETYPPGDAYYSDGISLSTILVPQYVTNIPEPRLSDKMPTFNGLSQSFDEMASSLMNMSPPKDVFIILGPADYTPMVAAPYAYDNQSGSIYIPNGNYSYQEEYFYTW